MQALYDVAAPAKLNLFLHITGRRADGYHLLQSVFMLIDWCDNLNFELRRDGVISREDLAAALPPEDLILRAARTLQAHSTCPLGVHIGVTKRIPSQAGMGGGSSDAASTLLALNRLWNLRLAQSELMAIGLTLGADVPFFLHGHHAWVQGIGEQISPIALPACEVLVAKPSLGVETASIFRDARLKRDSEPAIISGFAANPFGFGRNDMQEVAQRLCPGVGRALQWLDSLGLRGRMTGSGSAVFAQVSRPVEISGAPDDLQVRLCHNLEAHPLLGWATSDSFLVSGA